ncbi:cache domain-containing protein [Rhodococcus koreensis]
MATSPEQMFVAVVDALLAPLVSHLHREALRVSEIVDCASGDLSEAVDTYDGFRGVVADCELVIGAGFMGVPAEFGHRRYLAWWGVTTHGIDRLHLDIDDQTQSYLNYTMRPYFTAPSATRSMHVEGPYVDYLGVGSYVVTISVPVMVGPTFLGTVGLDISVEKLQARLARSIPTVSGKQLALVNAKGRVILSDTADLASGSLLRAPEVMHALANWPQYQESEQPHIYVCSEVPWALTVLPAACGHDTDGKWSL